MFDISNLNHSWTIKCVSKINTFLLVSWWRHAMAIFSTLLALCMGNPPVTGVFTSKKGQQYHDDVIKWKHFPRYWPFVRIIHRSPVNSPHKGQWRRALMFSLICVWINGWVNNREAGDLRRYRAHYDVFVMWRFDMIFVSRLNELLNKQAPDSCFEMPWRSGDATAMFCLYWLHHHFLTDWKTVIHFLLGSFTGNIPEFQRSNPEI